MCDVSMREKLLDLGFEETVCLDQLYDDAFIGIDSNYRAVYDYEKMIACLMKEGATIDEAMGYIDYDVIGSLPYSEIECSTPVIVYSIEWLGI